MAWAYLLIAIITEVIATSALKLSNGFTRLMPTTISLLGYLIAFYFLALTLRTIPVGVAYAIWSGVGIVAISIIGLFWFNQTLKTTEIIGILFILLGVIILKIQ